MSSEWFWHGKEQKFLTRLSSRIKLSSEFEFKFHSLPYPSVSVSGSWGWKRDIPLPAVSMFRWRQKPPSSSLSVKVRCTSAEKRKSVCEQNHHDKISPQFRSCKTIANFQFQLQIILAQEEFNYHWQCHSFTLHCSNLISIFYLIMVESFQNMTKIWRCDEEEATTLNVENWFFLLIRRSMSSTSSCEKEIRSV